MSIITDTPAYQRAAAVGLAHGPDWRPVQAFSAPGRVELIGNHNDYNGGPVLCAAIDRRAVVLAGPDRGEALAVVFADHSDRAMTRIAIADVLDWRNAAGPKSTDYVRGALAAVIGRYGSDLSVPTTLAVAGDVPIGFGVSSSAALCVSLVLAFAPERPEDRDLVLLAQEAEHRAGTPCGTMDQSASVAGGVIEYDGATVMVERLDPDLKDCVFAVINSGVERSLGTSLYPVRVAESKQELAIARRVLDPALPHVAAIDETGLERLLLLPEDEFPRVLGDRIRHIVTETRRVRDARRAVEEGDWVTFGRLMTESGRSSDVNYNISHPRVEEMVAETLTVPRVLGARMMGGGQGGSALALLRKDAVTAVEETLGRGYFAKYGMAGGETDVQICRFGPGALIEALYST